MINNEIDIIIQKFLNNKATQEEIEILGKWVKTNKSNFRKQIELHYLVTGIFKKEKVEQLKKDLIQEIFGQIKVMHKRRLRLRIFRYAAIFIGIVSLGFFYYTQINKVVDPTQQEITITLEDGSSKEILEYNASSLVSETSTYVAKQEGTKIIYNKISVKNQELKSLVYNTLDVPYGKKFQIVLSDGTEVYLNSGSSLTYPVAFYDNGPRKVDLKGEAYFTVKSDSLRPFFVGTEFIDTKVLGTEFNITNYKDDEYTKVVLVQGSLSVIKSNNSDKISIVLTPNQLASYSFSDKNLEVENVDISSYIAWKDGIMLFKNEDFYHITKKLERHYDIEIEIVGMEVGNGRYTGRFKTETIEEVLMAFQRIKGFDYSINENKITINPKN